jgi:abortive infection bacteriophage resistance protein
MTDTDSLMHKIDAKDFYEDMKTDSQQYDMSNFDCDLTKQYKNNNNKKVVGKFKDEGDVQIWSEFVGLRPEMYSASMHNGLEKKTCKGIKRDYLKKNVTRADYVRCIRVVRT